jgi:hypothetical protein
MQSSAASDQRHALWRGAEHHASFAGRVPRDCYSRRRRNASTSHRFLNRRLFLGDQMTIHALSPWDFDRFNSARATVARHTDTAVEWFADDTGAVLGAIAYHHLNLEWSLVVLGKDRHGKFCTVEHDSGLHILDEARRLVVEKMAVALARRPVAAWTNATKAGRRAAA